MELVTIKTCRGVESYLWINGALAPLEMFLEKFPMLSTRIQLSISEQISASSRFRAAEATTIPATAAAECASSPATQE